MSPTIQAAGFRAIRVVAEGCPLSPVDTAVNDLGEFIPTRYGRRTLPAAAAIGDEHAIIYYYYVYYYIYYYISVYIRTVCNIILNRLPCWTARTAILFADL